VLQGFDAANTRTHGTGSAIGGEFAMHPDTSRSFVAREQEEEQEELTEEQAGQ